MKYNYELDYSRIKDLRIERKLKQKDIADFLNIHQTTYSKFEILDLVIPIELLNKLSNYYNVSLDYLLKLSNTSNINIINKELDINLIGERLKKIRTENNLSERDLAINLGINNSIINEYESGRKLIPLIYSYAICKKYNISMDYLYGKSNEKDLSVAVKI